MLERIGDLKETGMRHLCRGMNFSICLSAANQDTRPGQPSPEDRVMWVPSRQWQRFINVLIIFINVLNQTLQVKSFFLGGWINSNLQVTVDAEEMSKLFAKPPFNVDCADTQSELSRFCCAGQCRRQEQPCL